MNYKQAYSSLRSFGVPADEAREALDQAEHGTAEAGPVTVTFSSVNGFVLTEVKK